MCVCVIRYEYSCEKRERTRKEESKEQGAFVCVRVNRDLYVLERK